MILQKIQDATEAMARERETWMKVIMSLLVGGMTEWAYYPCELTFGGDNRALVPIKSILLIKTANVAGSRNFSSS